MFLCVCNDSGQEPLNFRNAGDQDDLITALVLLANISEERSVSGDE